MRFIIYKTFLLLFSMWYDVSRSHLSGMRTTNFCEVSDSIGQGAVLRLTCSPFVVWEADSGGDSSIPRTVVVFWIEVSMSPKHPGPVFIVGAPRTGTTLIREILTLHPDIHIYDEVHFCERIFDRFGERPELEPETLKSAARHLLTETKWGGATDDLEASIAKLIETAGPSPVTYADLFRGYLEFEAAIHGKTVWGDSSPQDILYMDLLKSWYPEAKFITVVRDPRAYLASYKNYVRKGISSYRNRYNPIINSLLWKRYMNTAVGAADRSWHGDVMRMHYEHLVGNPEKSIRKLCRFIGLEFHEGMLQVGRQNSSYIAVKDDYAAKGINQQSLERWRGSLSVAEQWIVEQVAAGPMTRLGYTAEIRRLPISQWPSLLGYLFLLPPRLFNMLFRSRKPFTFAKLRKVLGG